MGRACHPVVSFRTPLAWQDDAEQRPGTRLQPLYPWIVYGYKSYQDKVGLMASHPMTAKLLPAQRARTDTASKTALVPTESHPV